MHIIVGFRKQPQQNRKESFKKAETRDIITYFKKRYDASDT